jgi:poly(hydroxyalkanoate) granule-associated protein
MSTKTITDAAREAEQQAEAAITSVRQGVTDQVEQQVQLAKGLVEIVQNAALDLYGSAYTVAEKAVSEATKSFDELVKKGEAFHAGEKAEAAVEEAEQTAQAAADAATERFNEAMGTFEKARQQFQQRLDAVLGESMRRAGLPTRDDVASLRASVDALNARIVELSKR